MVEVGQGPSAWVHGEYAKEKLRVRERYWRSVPEVLNLLASPSSNIATTTTEGNRKDEDSAAAQCWILPDGIVWRKYLALLSRWIEEGNNPEATAVNGCKWILLESAVEWMDYRNISPSLLVVSDNSATDSKSLLIPESAAIQERSKLQKLLQSYPNTIFPFCDLSVRETDTEGREGSGYMDEWDMMGYSTMTIAERTSHAMIRAGQMIEQHVAPRISGGAKVILLSSDANFCQKFPSEDGVETIFMEHFIDLMINLGRFSKDKLDKWILLKSRCEDEYERRNAPPTVAADGSADVQQESQYWSDFLIYQGLQNGSLVKGVLNVTKENSMEAAVLVGNGDTYFVNQRLRHFNRAFHQDNVVLKPLPQSQWGRPLGKRRLVHHRDDNDDDLTTDADMDDNDATPPVPSARVVAIVQTGRRTFVATMVDTPTNDESACLVVPMDIRIPKIRLRTGSWRNFVQKRLLIQIDAWDVGSNYPHGRCIEILGPVADLETEIKSLLYENEVSLDPFSAAALACLPPVGPAWTIPAEEIQARRDLRTSHRIFSVDPPGCQDIDDTMHARVLPNGDVEVGVHIADVTYFVPHKSALDTEAQVRATTFYLVDRRFDMLPSLLSSDLCSLHGSTDRLAVSTIWTMSSDFHEIKSVWYGRTVIHNCQAMTYDQAHNILLGKQPDDPNKPRPPSLTAGSPVDPSNIAGLRHDLEILTRLARHLRKDREEIGGAVDLSSGDIGGSELKFSLDENNNPIKVTPKKDLEIHHTIAELMILANSWVAMKIHNTFPESALLRIHRTVEEERFEDLKEILNAGKISFDGSSNMSLANSLKQAEQGGKSGAVVNSLFRSLATRAMSEAQYICTGDHTKADGLSHYGLGLKFYTHFTSPIRRYADVIVHKQLLAAVATSLQVATASTNAQPKHSPLRRALPSLPDSSVISVLGGEGLKVSPMSDETNAALGRNEAYLSALSISDPPERLEYDTSSPSGPPRPHTMTEVSNICKTLNRQNRMAKISSMECQSLFLSLYFKEQVETTQAVVTNLRINGFWVYVPRFDMRGPVYLSDAGGHLQIDPALVGLESSTGLAPTLGFAGSKISRRFPSGKCTLIKDAEDERLEVTVAQSRKSLTVHTLDVVTIQVMCDDWDVRARVPSPRLHLIFSSASLQPLGTIPGHPAAKTNQKQKVQQEAKAGEHWNMESFTVYNELMKIRSRSVLEGVPLRSRHGNPSVTPAPKGSIPIMAGRAIFGEFVNPDTRSATNEAGILAASDAAALRREHVMAMRAHNAEYDTSRRIEQNVMARTQRLAAGKRNTRKSQAK